MDVYSDTNNKLPADFHSSEIRLCIFLITSVCVGLPALIWSFCLLHLYRKIRGRISAFIVLLLLSDLIQLLLNLYIVTYVLTKCKYSNLQLFPFWSTLPWCGFYLHQLVALEWVLRLKYPTCSAHIFSLPCYIIISILVLLFFIISAFIVMHPFGTINISLFSLGTCLASLSLLVIIFTISCKASSTPVSKNTCSVLTVVIVNFVMLYLPFILVICVNFFPVHGVNTSWFVMSLCLLSLRVTSDPILCVLVCRENLKDVQTPQTHTDPYETLV